MGFFIGGQAHAHDIDNRATCLNGQVPGNPGGSSDIRCRSRASEPLHCDGGVCEGKFTNPLLEDESIKYRGQTFFQAHKNFGHWRRTLVNKIVQLAGNVNAAQWIAWQKGINTPIPFMSYDPLNEGSDRFHPDVQAQYTATLVPQGYKPFGVHHERANYGEFWVSQVVNINGIGGDTNPIKYKRCDQVSPHEQIHAPECLTLPGSQKVMIGGDSYRTPFPNRGEGIFNYYDRIPMSPGDDANLRHAYGEWSTQHAISYIYDHGVAGKNHAEDVVAKVKYSELIIQKLLAQ